MNQFPFPLKIETAFKAMKTSGFNSEDTHLTVVGCTIVSYTYTID